MLESGLRTSWVTCAAMRPMAASRSVWMRRDLVAIASDTSSATTRTPREPLSPVSSPNGVTRDVHQALVETGDSLAFQGQRISSLGNFVDGATKRRKPSKERGVIDRRTDIASADPENLFGSRVRGLDDAILDR